MYLANALTCFRIFVSPVFLLVYSYPGWFGISDLWLPMVLFVLVTVSELSDALDGYLARLYGQVTDLGKLLDPMADSIYRLSLFLTFTLPPVHLSVGWLFPFFYRDSVVSMLRTVCALRGFALAARKSGKLKAVFQALAVFIILSLMQAEALGYISQADLTRYSTYTIALAGVYALLSGIDYLMANWRYLKLALLPVRRTARKKNLPHDAGDRSLKH